MTAIHPRVYTRPLSDSSDSLLRFALRVDGTVCAVTGLLVAMTADQLARLSGPPATAVWISGALLVGWGFVLYVLAVTRRIRRVGLGVLVGNVIASAGIGAALVTHALPLTAAGTTLVAAFLIIGLGCAWLQYLGVRRLA